MKRLLFLGILSIFVFTGCEKEIKTEAYFEKLSHEDLKKYVDKCSKDEKMTDSEIKECQNATKVYSQKIVPEFLKGFKNNGEKILKDLSEHGKEFKEELNKQMEEFDKEFEKRSEEFNKQKEDFFKNWNKNI